MHRARVIAVLCLACFVLLLPSTALAIVAAVAIAQPAGAATKTKVVKDCVHAGVTPRTITFGCASGWPWATKLHWRFWWKRRAFAKGRFHYNDCDPNCAEGNFHVRRGRVLLRDRESCGGGLCTFHRARVRYAGRVEVWPMGCPS